MIEYKDAIRACNSTYPISSKMYGHWSVGLKLDYKTSNNKLVTLSISLSLSEVMAGIYSWVYILKRIDAELVSL
jgi:hypothetical protein